MAKKNVANNDKLNYFEALNFTEIIRGIKVNDLGKDSLFKLIDLAKRLQDTTEEYYKKVTDTMLNNDVKKNSIGNFDLSTKTDEEISELNSMISRLQEEKTEIDNMQNILTKDEFMNVINRDMTIAVVQSLESFLIKN